MIQDRWTIAYRRPAAIRFMQATGWSGTEDEAHDMHLMIQKMYPTWHVYCLNISYEHAQEDNGRLFNALLLRGLVEC